MTSRGLTTDTVRPQQISSLAIKPEWIRLPKPGTLCTHTGLSRSKLNELILGSKPPVHSVSLRRRGQLRGTRLINYDSLLAFLQSLDTQGDCHE